MTPKDIHHLANKLGVKWDSDPRFMARCKAWVGKEHLDAMTSAELRTVAQHLKDGVKEAAAMQPGDVIVMSPQYEAGEGRVSKVFGAGSAAAQGSMTHSALYVGKGHVIEARLGEGVTKKTLKDALSGKSYMIMRPKVHKQYRKRAVDFAHAQLGKAYDTGALVGASAGLIASPVMAAFADKRIAAAANSFTCSNLITSAYEGTPLTKLKRLAAPVHLRYSKMLTAIKHHEEVPVQHVLPTAKVGELPAPAVLKQLKTFGPPNEWSGAVASIAGPEGRAAMQQGWKKMDAGERSTVSQAFRASFGKEAEDTRKSTTLKGLGTNTARGALAGMAGGALIAPMMGTPGQVLLGLGGHSLSQAGQGAAAGAGLGLLFEAGKLQGIQEQIAEHQLQNPDMDISTLGKLDTGIARGQKVLLGSNMGDASLRGAGAGALGGLVYGLVKGHGTPTERALLAAQTMGMGALKGTMAGAGLGAIRGMGVTSGRAGERSAFLEQQAKQAESPEKKKALLKVESFHQPKAKDWDAFLQDTGRKSFVQALKNDPRSDEKLKQHAEMMNRLQMGKPIASIKGALGNYDIVQLRGGGLGCTCNDWRFKRSVAAVGARDCKHLKHFREEKGSKIAMYEFLEPAAQAWNYLEHNPGTAMALGALKANLGFAFGHHIPLVKDILQPHYVGMAQAGARLGVAGKEMPWWSHPLAAVDLGAHKAMEAGVKGGKTLRRMGHTELPTPEQLTDMASEMRGHGSLVPQYSGLVDEGVEAVEALKPVTKPSVLGHVYTALSSPSLGAQGLREAPGLLKQNLQAAPGMLLRNIKDTPRQVGQDLRSIGQKVQSGAQQLHDAVGFQRAPTAVPSVPPPNPAAPPPVPHYQMAKPLM